MLRGFIRRSRNSFVQPTNLKAAQCVSWLRDQATCFAAVSSMAKAATLLPNSLRSKLELDAQYIGPSLLRSMVSNNVIQSSIISGTLSSTMSILHDVISDWKSISVSPLTKAITRQLQSTLQFITTTDPVSGDLIIRTLAALSSGGERIEMDPPVLEKLLQEPSLDRDGKRAVLTLLWSSLQEIEEIRIRNMSRLPSFLQLGQALSDTMWLNQAHTIPDYDEQRFKFRAWWVKLCPREAWFASAFRKSLEQLKEDPRISHEVKLEGVKALLPTAALQVWNSQHWYKGWTVCRFWYEKEKDGLPEEGQQKIRAAQSQIAALLEGELEGDSGITSQDNVENS
ncbi:hypothetical protein FRC02_000413 [Tulasnella sp. 418]|nr:hypothetical protein FRC02_000413 [Tulasnella sp. 418]